MYYVLPCSSIQFAVTLYCIIGAAAAHMFAFSFFFHIYIVKP